MDLAIRKCRPDGLGKFDQEVGMGVVLKGMNCVEAKAIETVIPQPHQCVIDEKPSNERAVLAFQVNGWTPPGGMTISEKVFGVAMKEVTVWPEVVIDNIEVNHDVEFVRRS